jgi:hypothetical protein
LGYICVSQRLHVQNSNECEDMPKDDGISTDLTRSEELLRQLQAGARKSKKEALTRLFAVLSDIQRSGISDFTLAHVGAQFERVGGLRTQ